MNYKILFILISIIFVVGCEQINVKDEIVLNSQLKYKNSGFEEHKKKMGNKNMCFSTKGDSYRYFYVYK